MHQQLILGGEQILDWSEGPLVMGVLNITPDSFSDGGEHVELDAVVRAAGVMVASGVAIIDVGGESTRPGSDPVSAEREIERVVPVVAAIRSRWSVPISVDTMKSEVARAAIEAGADMVNDVSAMEFDEQMTPTVVELEVPVILMHMRGTPKTMQESIDFDDLMGEIGLELIAARDRAIQAGTKVFRVFIDPGIGFGKTFDHNLEVLARCGELSDIGPLVIGASRKAFVGQLTGREAGSPRMAGSLAAVAAAVRGGAAIVRVHDVPETVDFLRVMKAIGSAG